MYYYFRWCTVTNPFSLKTSSLSFSSIVERWVATYLSSLSILPIFFPIYLYLWINLSNDFNCDKLSHYSYHLLSYLLLTGNYSSMSSQLFNIPKIFDLEHGGDLRVFVLDNHRPFHLANIYSRYSGRWVVMMVIAMMMMMMINDNDDGDDSDNHRWWQWWMMMMMMLTSL